MGARKRKIKPKTNVKHTGKCGKKVKGQETDPSLKFTKHTLSDHFFCKHMKDNGLEK